MRVCLTAVRSNELRWQHFEDDCWSDFQKLFLVSSLLLSFLYLCHNNSMLGWKIQTKKQTKKRNPPSYPPTPLVKKHLTNGWGYAMMKVRSNCRSSEGLGDLKHNQDDLYFLRNPFALCIHHKVKSWLVGRDQCVYNPRVCRGMKSMNSSIVG